MTPLLDKLLRRIQSTGPLPVSDYMSECLLHPTFGYYATRDPLGTAGDFITAPEISQMFGELLGLAMAQCWMDQGRPGKFALVELGPGRGTLMKDILRATKTVPGFRDAAQIHLVEASPVLREIQARTIGRDDIQWHTQFSDIPDGPLYVIANEFFDALPIRQFVRDTDGWRERQIGANNGALMFGLSGTAPIVGLAGRLADTAVGDLVEVNPAAATITGQIADRISRNTGAAIIVDYGDWNSLGDTFQAVRDHEPDDPLAAPGLADLTAHVDFAALCRAATNCATSQMTPQGVLLERLGITARAQTLATGLSGDALTRHVAAHRRLTHADEMGTLFKAIAIYPNGSAPPPGFAS